MVYSVDKYKFTDFWADMEFIHFKHEGEWYKRVYRRLKAYPYHYIFTFNNKVYRVQF